ncbi:MAG: penicillin acylase family protein, partial [Catalinimonas sp.]
VWGAERALETALADPQSREMVEAYTDGVNAWLRDLPREDYPVEFKLLAYDPEPWTPLKSALMLKQMTANLTTGTEDLYLTRALQTLGRAAVDSLFPRHPYQTDPIIPQGTPWNFTPKPRPAAPPDWTAAAVRHRFPYAPDPDNGSNNWAISAERSATGYPILANDPHLELSLPSLWYEIQLHAPGVNVAGVSLPGAPTVIIGFNERIAWGVTNVDADVLDFYEIDFVDAARTEYRHGEEVRPVRLVEERIKVRNHGFELDTVRYTHHGPLVYDSAGATSFSRRIPAGLAMRWIAHDPSNEFLTFHALNRATNYEAFTAALSHYVAPAQNFVYADADKHIALWVMGRFPLKWPEQGKYVLDGSNPAHDWQGWVPAAHNPHVLDPPRGFVSSANQSSVDSTYPYYLNWEQAPLGRGARINEVLAGMQNATQDSLRRLQNDNLSHHARAALPRLLAGVRADELTPEQAEVLDAFRTWDFRYEADARLPTVFDAWWDTYVAAVWEDNLGDTLLRYPSRVTTLHLIDSFPTSPWFDLDSTPARETAADLAHTSFAATVDTLVSELGPWGDDWAWADTKGTNVRHVARLDGFGTDVLRMGGGSGIPNATKRTHGPSWRMLVETGPRVRAWGIYPGGPSGNPGSRYYDNQVETWRRGELREIVYLRGPAEQPDSTAGHLHLTTAAGE